MSRDFDFELPAELIAQDPAADADAARLSSPRSRRPARSRTPTVASLPSASRAPAISLVVNNTRVFPARLLGRRVPSGGAVECLLIRRESRSDGSRRSGRSRDGSAEPWEALMHPGQKLNPGARLVFRRSAYASTARCWSAASTAAASIRLWTDDGSPVDEAVDAIGHVPLPPYIKRDDRAGGSRALPDGVRARRAGRSPRRPPGCISRPRCSTALAARGIEMRGNHAARRLRHVSAGSRRARRRPSARGGAATTIDAGGSSAINRALDERPARHRRRHDDDADARSGRAGATTVGSWPAAGTTDLFIYPGFEFRVVGGLLTNFHLPRSSLLMLVSAFAGRERVLDAYRAAIAERYRFYSYGDAMLIT